MKSSINFLDAIKQKYSLTSDGQLARMLNVTSASISSLRQGKSYLGEDSCIKVAELLRISPEFVMSCANAERAKNDKVRLVWERLASRLEAGLKLAA